MRYVILIFAFVLSSEIFINQGISKVCLALTLAGSVLAAYTVGRLGKRTRALILFSLVAAVLIAIIIAGILAPIPLKTMDAPVPPALPEAGVEAAASAIQPKPNGAPLSSLCFNLSRCLFWITIGCLYAVKYNSHKEAGRTVPTEKGLLQKRKSAIAPFSVQTFAKSIEQEKTSTKTQKMVFRTNKKKREFQKIQNLVKKQGIKMGSQFLGVALSDILH